MKKQFFILLICAGITISTYSNAQEDFKPSVNLWGYVFGDYAVKSHNDTLSRGGGSVQYKGTNPLSSSNVVSGTNPAPANMQTDAFQIRRVYLGYDYRLTKNISAQIVLAK